ncbi:microfibril-associated glycoprotein 4-like [Crassostrea virginica]
MTFLSLYVVCVLAFIPKCRSLCSKPEIINTSPQGFSLGIGHTFKTFPTPSVFACMEMCISYPMCRSIDFNREIGECRLQVKSSVTDPGLLVSTPNTFHMDKEHFPQTLMDNVCQTLSCDNKTMCKGYSGCVPVLDGKTCGSPPSVPNAEANPAGPFPVGHTHNYTCNVHFYPLHESYTTCQENGKWSNVVFRCQEEMDCFAILKIHSNTSGQDGVYTIHPNKATGRNVFCDMTTDGGGWTVIQNRVDGSTDFYRTWNEYKEGFGDPSYNYWIGNDVLHLLTKNEPKKLRVELQRFSGERGYAEYSTFAVGDESSKYQLTVSGFEGNIGDSLLYHNGMKFSTRDQDNDKYSGGSCSQVSHGAWWYKGCHYSNLNGKYMDTATNDYKSNSWYYWKNNYESLQITRMMIRPANI